jgi:autotransporter-associated beta strand protein
MGFLPRLILMPCLAVLAASIGASFADEPSAPLGRYTFVIGAADGGSEAGCGTFTVNARGAVRGVVRLVNGLVFSSGGELREDGVWPLSVTLRDGRTLRGDVTFDGANRCSAALLWEGPVKVVTLPARGEAFQLPARAPAQSSYVPLRLTGGRYLGRAEFLRWKSLGSLRVIVSAQTGVGESFESEVRLSPSGVFCQIRPGSRAFAVQLDPNTGLVSGCVSAPNLVAGRLGVREKEPYAAYGAVLALDGRISGFVAGSQGGTFDVTSAVAVDDGSGTASGGVVKTGVGTLTLSGSNSYTGATLTVTGGTLQIGTGNTLTTGTGTLDTVNWLNGGTIPLNPGITLAPGTVTGTGSVAAPGATLWVNGGSTGAIGGNAGTAQIGSGSSINLNGGTLTLGNGATGGTFLVTGSGNLIVIPGTQIGGVNLNLTNGNTGTLTPTTATPRLVIAPAAFSTFASSFSVTNEAGEAIALPDVADGQIILVGGRRYRAERPIPEGPVTLVSAPL